MVVHSAQHHSVSFALFCLFALLVFPVSASSACSAQSIRQQQSRVFPMRDVLSFLPELLGEEGVPAVKQQKYQVVARYPHDATAFTEGLVFYGDTLYESTGLLGASSVRKVVFKTGQILEKRALDDRYFAEGITVFNHQLIQLTWKNETGFVYQFNPLQVIQQFYFSGEGWGNTVFNNQLVISNGSSFLQFFPAVNHRMTQVIQVKEKNYAITGLNELEAVQGAIYANVWPTNCVAKIHPQTGRVQSWLDLSALAAENHLSKASLLNGIAYYQKNGHFFVTGKYWVYLYEIRLL